jgi:hypothetical protein
MTSSIPSIVRDLLEHRLCVQIHICNAKLKHDLVVKVPPRNENYVQPWVISIVLVKLTRPSKIHLCPRPVIKKRKSLNEMSDDRRLQSWQQWWRLCPVCREYIMIAILLVIYL